MNYFTSTAIFSEKMAVSLLKNCGVDCHRNNEIEVTAVDIITSQNIRIDVQISNNFSRYGEYRLDMVSAFMPRNIQCEKIYKYDNALGFIKNFELKYRCKVVKVGKIFQKDYLDFMLIFFYNNKFSYNKPDKILLVSKNDLIDFIKPRIAKLFDKVKYNNKYNLNDEHGSAFLPINVTMLAWVTNCFFGNYSEFIDNKHLISDYLAGEGVSWLY